MNREMRFATDPVHAVRWILLIYCAWVCCVHSQGFTLRQGLYDKLTAAEHRLANNFHHNSKVKSELNMKKSMLWTKTLDDLYPGIKMSSRITEVVKLHNYTLLLSGLDIWSLEQEQLIKKASLPKFFHGGEVKLIKSINWQEKLFLLVCFKNEQCSLYTSSFEFDHFKYHHSISDAGIPIYAEFFVQNNTLFLTVLYQTLHSRSSQTRIYCWQNMYLHRLDLTPEMISTAMSITVFNYKDNILLILRCSGSDKITSPSQVWSRTSSGEIRLVQNLATTNPLSITHFVHSGENFLLIFEENQNAAIYWWEGSQFVFWMPMDQVLKYFKVSTSMNMNNTFLIFTHENNLLTYLMTSKSLEKVLDIKLLNHLDVFSIMSADMYNINGKTYMFVLSQAEDKVYFTLLQVHIDYSYAGYSEIPSSKPSRRNTAQEALEVVFSRVSRMEDQLHRLDASMQTLLLTNRRATINNTVTIVSGAVKVQGGEIWNLINKDMGLAWAVQYISLQLSHLREDINSYLSALNSTKMHNNRHIVYIGNVHLHKAKINVLFAHNTLNNKTFKPESLLSITNNTQRIERVEAKTLRANWLLVFQLIGDKPVNGLFLNDSTIRVPMHTTQLQSWNLEISEHGNINNVTAEDVKINAVRMESGEDSFNKIEQVVSEQKTRQHATTLQLQDYTVIENLNVDEINKVAFNELIKTLFIKQVKTIVNGKLHFRKRLKIRQLAHNRPIKTTEPNAQIYSQNNKGVHYSPRIFPTQANYHVLPYQPVLSQNIYYILPPSAEWRMKREVGDEKRSVKHIRKKVKIQGNVKVHRLLFRNSSLTTNNYSVPTANLDEVFWTHSTSQVIPHQVNFSLGVKLLHELENPILNGKNVSQYATRRSTFHSLVLENVHVDGDISTEEDIMVNETVWNQSYPSRHKGFECDVLEVKHLHAEYINGKPLQNILRVGHFLNNGLKIFTANLSVKGDMDADFINYVDVKNKFKTAVLSSEDCSLNDVVFTKMSAKIADIDFMNNYPVKDLLYKVLGQNKSVYLSGNLHIAQLENVHFVNNNLANLNLVVNRSKPATIYGKKEFPFQTSLVSVLNVTTLNNGTIENLLERLMKKSTDQVITGFYTIRRASMKSLNNVSEINNIDTSELIYIDQPCVNVSEDIHFTSILVAGNLVASNFLKNCSLPKVDNQFVFDRASVWSSLVITGDSEWPVTNNGRLHHLLNSAVTTTGDQNISGAVFISDLFSKSVQVKTLNNKNITFVFEDSLSRKKKDQVISGRKHFTGSVKCNSVGVKGDVMFGSVNSLRINEINERLVRRMVDDDSLTKPISGHKTFMAGFQAYTLVCKEGVNGISPDSMTKDFYRETLPPAVVDRLVVLGSLEVETINDLNIDSFLKDCVYSKHPQSQLLGQQFHIIGNVILQGNLTASNINNISNSDLVFVQSVKDTVVIKGCKSFSRPIVLETDSDIDILNEKGLSETHKKSVKRYQNVTINGSLVLLSEVYIYTIHAQKYFVGSKEIIHLNKTDYP